MADKKIDYQARDITWTIVDDSEAPYVAHIDGVKLSVGINDFPDEELYTLSVDGKEVERFDNWPNCWQR